MHLEFCDTKINFGDSLNEWLWPKIINKKFNAQSNVYFLGIGTIITDKRVLEIEKKMYHRPLFFPQVRGEIKAILLVKTGRFMV